MHPTHLSCPSSSTTDYAQPHVTSFVRSLLSSAGFSKSSSQAIELLTEVFERYLLLLASTSKHQSNHVGRRVSLPCDVERALNELGSSTDNIQSWFDEEGGDIAGRWLEVEQVQSDIPTARQLGERLKLGRVSSLDEGSLVYHYRNIEEDERVRLSEINIADDEEEDEDEDGEGAEVLSPPPPYQRKEENGIASHPPTYKRRRLQASVVDYIPSFLPAFPDRDKSEDASSEGAQEADAEFERERERRVQMGVDRKELLNDTNETKEDQEARAWATMDMAPAPKRATEDSWHSAVDFASSTLAQQQSIEDIPEGIEEKDDTTTIRYEQESSHRIFANDYLALVAEQKSVPPALLTPSGSAFASVFNQRRNLASILADPSKYVPTDTIFGSIDARPSARPFQPGPSLLITPPTNTNSAPTFTPIQASGRELISTSTINNSLHPACRHRIPNNTLSASRYLSGGESGEIFRRVTRTLDPIPILDERHAERVFHGIQAPKEHLSESNSYLREALEVLKMKRAEEIRVGIENGTIDEVQSQLSMSTNRDKLRVKSGTLVQTWDWMSRDYTDAVLPGKKYRNNTAGVFVSGSEADQSFGS